jgi:hypothetical protein
MIDPFWGLPGVVPPQSDVFGCRATHVYALRVPHADQCRRGDAASFIHGQLR